MLAQQLGMAAVLDDVPAVQNQDFVRSHDRGKPMCDYESGLILGQSFKFLMNCVF